MLQHTCWEVESDADTVVVAVGEEGKMGQTVNIPPLTAYPFQLI